MSTLVKNFVFIQLHILYYRPCILYNVCTVCKTVECAQFIARALAP